MKKVLEQKSLLFGFCWIQFESRHFVSKEI